MSFNRSPDRCMIPLLLMLGLGACAGTPGTVPPRHTLPAGRAATLEAERLSDPMERVNRGVYNFNRQFDRYIFLPAVDAYRYVLPDPVETGVRNFFANLGEFRNAMNGLLQGRGEVATTALSRLLINSTVGFLGVLDVAQSLNIAERREDFGQTLGRWGAAPGPYLVLPLLGPSSLRDATGFAADLAAGSTLPVVSTVNELVFFDPAVYALYAIDLREAQTFRYYDSGSPFEYDLVRYLYTRKRELDVLR